MTKPGNCRVCGSELLNDIYGSRCEDCWAVKQPAYDKQVPRTGRRRSLTDPDAQYDHGLKPWRWIDLWSRRYDDA